MLNFSVNISMIFFFMSCSFYFYMYKYILLTLLSLEFISLSLIFNMYNLFIQMDSNIIMILYMMVFSICEGVLGLSLLVMYIRLDGEDMLDLMNLILW
uniref:NADH-ubiquinone oxidoreductase chain 4L n=1 Tax=Vanhornia eucnemidarum TaxID=32432 RepID=Q0H2F3_9HYME|nr:NADH dehydrogenase subunit 4L [Vanhornia eucnemidarum]